MLLSLPILWFCFLFQDTKFSLFSLSPSPFIAKGLFFLPFGLFPLDVWKAVPLSGDYPVKSSCPFK